MKKYFLIILFLVPMLVNAHPGHGLSNGVTPDHYLTSIIHLLPIVFTLIIIFIFMRKLKPSTE